MNKTKVAVLVSGGGTNLQKILEAQAAGNTPHAEVVLVLSDHKDAYALKRAENFGVATAVVEKTGTQAEFESSVIAALRASGAEMIVLAGFLRILTENFIKEYENKIINVHPSLIPSFCGKGFYGLKVHEAALNKGVKVTGATVHFVNEIPDGGAIIAQKAVEVKEGDTPEILQKRVMEEAEWILLPQAVETVAKKILMEKLS
ncbi:MAG: phosphoribosylglycinamide formyltransferase [Clostridia bacterium]|nr:phosphoribosylglycinamide formyltransferase [Clostridia bacterium]